MNYAETNDEVKNRVIIPANFDEAEETKIIEEIDEEIKTIQAERDSFCDEGLEAKWQKEKDLYEGIVEPSDYPWEGSANYHIPVTASLIDILSIKAKKQAIMPEPMVILEPQETLTDADKKVVDLIKDRENKLEIYLRHNVDIDKIYTPLFRNAAMNGVGILKICYENEQEERKYYDVYTPTKEDITRYLKDYADKLEDEKVKEQFNLLQSGETIRVIKSEAVEIYNGVKVYRVPIEDFYVRPSIRELRRHRVIAEKFTFSWQDIEARALSGFWDRDKVEVLKEKYPDDYYKRSYDFFEAIVKCDVKEQGKFYKYVIVYHPDSKVIVRAIYFPYDHNRVYYVPYYIKPRDDSFYGYSISDRLKDLNKMIDNLWNITFNTSSIAHAPVIMTDNPSLDLTTRNWGPLSVLTKPKGSSIDVLKLDMPQMDTMGLFEWSIKLSEMSTGISATLMSGGELSRDPRAPAAKTAMLLRESNIIIEDAITELQQGTQELALQVESLCAQYGLIEYQPESLKIKVNYIPQGGQIPIDKAMDLNILMGFIEVAKVVYPEVFQDVEKRYQLVNLYVNLAGGSIEKYKSRILESPDSIKRKQLKEMLKSFIEQIKERRAQQQSMPQGAGGEMPVSGMGQMPVSGQEENMSQALPQEE